MVVASIHGILSSKKQYTPASHSNTERPHELNVSRKTQTPKRTYSFIPFIYSSKPGKGVRVRRVVTLGGSAGGLWDWGSYFCF